MIVLHNQKRCAAPAVSLGVLTLGVFLLGFASLVRAADQSPAAHSYVVSVKSDPSGAVIWKKAGRDYICTDTLTPGTVELTFHDDNDVQRLRLRKFGYSVKNIDVKPADTEVQATLGQPYSKSFRIADDAAPHLKQLNSALKTEFENTLPADRDAFQCAPFDLDYVHLDKDKEVDAVDLNVAIKLDRSFGGPAFRLASHGVNTPERRQKMGRAALENGVAEILARFHRLAANFQDVKAINVLCSYSATEAVLEKETYTSVEYHPVVQNVQQPTLVFNSPGPVSGPHFQNNPGVAPVGGTHLEMQSHQQVVNQASTVTHEQDVVKDVAATKTITFVMPTAKIPDTLDKKAITDAVLAHGTILTESTLN
ncbi:MAG: hypothetical protein ABSA12_08910 [Verrucomicrobiia bacterium]|jgi:hypothetical protein